MHHLGGVAELKFVAKVGGMRRLSGRRNPLVTTVAVFELYLRAGRVLLDASVK